MPKYVGGLNEGLVRPREDPSKLRILRNELPVSVLTASHISDIYTRTLLRYDNFGDV